MFRVNNSILTSIWFKVFESILILFIMYIVFSNIVKDYYVLLCIFIPTISLVIYVEYTFKTPWPRILLPFSLGNSTLLASIMFHNTVDNPYIYKWIIVGYALAVFTLFHALSRMLSVFLRERKSRFRSILDGVLIDVLFFIIVSSSLTTILALYKAIIPIYGVLLIIGNVLVYVLVPWIIRKYILYGLFERRVAIMGYTHPRDIEIENFYFELSSIAVIFILTIPALLTYTSTSLERRAFIPLAMLSVYELLIMAIYTLTYLTSLHGAFIEILLGDKVVSIEYGKVVTKWRDVAWFMNNSLIYYLRMKYLSALYMLFQSLELLSFRVNNKSLYYGQVSNLIAEGHSVLEKNRLLTKYSLSKFIKETIDLFKTNNLYVIEPRVPSIINDTVYIEDMKKCLGSLVNIYCKINELGEVPVSDIKKSIQNSIRRLDIFRSKVSGLARREVENYIAKLNELINRNSYRISDFEEFIEKKELTINMFRNYLVHGQLYRNAIVYKGSRVEADRVLNKPSVLYGVYTLIVAAVLSKYPDLYKY